MQKRNLIFAVAAGLLALATAPVYGFPFHHKKYEKPISKDTMQPDKVLFDRAIKAIEHGNYEEARLILNTLINTYDTSEYLAKAQLAVADSWYREGGAHGMAQAEQGYKDFELFYPHMEEAAESQYKVCDIHYKQMEKADRDSAQAVRAEDECRQLLTQYPNSKFVKDAQQKLRNVQEVLAEKEFLAGDFYHHKGSFPAAANRFSYVTQQYPLYSGSDQALWEMADAYRKMGDRFEKEEGSALSKIVKDYPFSAHVDDAKERLTALKQSIPEADATAYARQKYDAENRKKLGMMSRAVGVVTGRPDTSLATKGGAPVMTAMRPPVPVSVPASAAGTQVPPAGGGTGVSDVSVGVVGTETLDQGKDARLSQQNGTLTAQGAGTGEQPASVSSNGQPTAAAAQPEAPPPSNHVATAKQIKEYQKAQLKLQQKAIRDAKKKGVVADPAVNAAPAPAATTPATTTPASTTTPATTPPQ